MKPIHTSLAAGRWQDLSLLEQLANVDSEVERALNWQEKNNPDYSHKAFMRALELLDLTLATKLSEGRMRELTLTREALVDYFLGKNVYQNTPKLWRAYFRPFTYASQLRRGV